MGDVPDLEKFREEAREWLEANCPESIRKPVSGEDDIVWGGRNWVFKSDDQKIWLDRMAERGWTVPEWPKEYGGGGLSKEEAKVLKQEMARIKAPPPVNSFGIWMLGPALLKFGSEEQKREHLPPICRGEIRWAQGYSEPGAGSDLAALQTRADDKGDHYIVNGQKVWTSYADECDKIFCLVRTDPSASKHEGISFLLIDMDQPGVTTKPIRLISGKSPFCETFFDDATAPKENLVGELNKGWTIAKYLLTHERAMIGGMDSSQVLGRSPGEIAADTVGRNSEGELADSFLRSDIARSDVDGWAFMLTMERYRDKSKAGEGVGAASSGLKYYGTELNKRRYELSMSASGFNALKIGDGIDSEEGEMARRWLRTKANSIEGGTSEVQLNIISKRILELPDA